MNTEQAKFILRGYRPNGADAGDATFSEALEQAKHDFVVRDWFAREQALDGAISAKLSQIPAPAGLREAILAGGRMTAPATSRRSWWRQPVWLAAAAGVAVLLTVTLALWPSQAVAGGSLDDFAVLDSRHSETHGGRGEETGRLQAALSQTTTHLGSPLPVSFADLHKNGCRTLSFRQHEVLEVCFKRNGVWFHCYIAQRADFPTLAAAVAPSLVDREGASVASWADSSLLYVVVSKAGRAALEQLL